MASQIDIWESEGIIKIKPKAYITMLKHVLAYGNKALGSDSVEVMGICMGKQVGENMVIYEAVPISHGSAIEVGFTPTDYVSFAQVDEDYANKGNGLFACGWYHSHPNMSAFLSGVDIKNHLFYQKEQTPKGFAIVFDHQYFEQPEDSEKDPHGTTKYGFKAFRLNDYTKGTSSDFHHSKVEIEAPDDLEVYSEIQNIIEASQNKKPIIHEIGGLDADDSIWAMDDEETPSEPEAVEKVEENSELDEVTQAAAEGMDAFTKEFTAEFLKQFDAFKNDTTKATQKGGSVMVDILATMKETVDKGVARVKKYLDSILYAELQSVDKELKETFKKMDTDQREFNKKFDEFSKKVGENIGNVVKDILGDKLGVVIDSIKEAANQSSVISENSDTFKATLTAQQKILEDLKLNLDKGTTGVEETINTLKEKISLETAEKAKSLSESSDDVKSLTKDIEELVNEISKKLS